ncbi:MAG TPA: uroporphyrinogen decarboxylase family protein [Phycisphaerae bacterium]|nr:uroporphyrinogen decarboxylase family protein [Phycisphaerae bacterium]
MNDYQRFRAQMHYEPVDRCPIWDFGFWDETLALWREQGMPADAHPDEYFGMDAQWRSIPIATRLLPAFEEQLIEDRGETEVVRDGEGVVVHRRKWMQTIPHYLDWTLKDRVSWQEHYVPRLDPDTPGRIPDDFAQRCRQVRDGYRDYPLGIAAGSMYGVLRNWMGMENISLLVYDDPDLFGEMVDTLGRLYVTILSRALAIAKDNGVTFDYASMWEDMCYSHGPLLGPNMVERYMMPHYVHITELLREHGVDVVVLDCDGCIDQLIPLWLGAGVNCMFPVEVGTWKADPIAYRQQYGKNLLMMGGFNKRVLAGTKDAISAEVRRLTPLVEEGGFIPFCDHRVPADVPLANYVHYLQEARRVWGKGVNLRPMPAASV